MTTRINGIAVPQFLRDEEFSQSFYRWNNERSYGKMALLALPCLIAYPFSDSAELHLAKNIQKHVANVEEDVDGGERSKIAEQALRTLASLKAQRSGSSETEKFGTIMKSISGGELKKILPKITGFKQKLGHLDAGQNRVVDPAKIIALNYQQAKKTLKEVNDLIEILEKLDGKDEMVGFQASDYLVVKGGQDGLIAYKDALEERMNALDDTLNTQKEALRKIIRDARRPWVSRWKQETLQTKLADVRTALAARDVRADNSKEALEALGMKGYNSVTGYLNAVEECISKGVASRSLADSDLANTSRQAFSPFYDLGAFALGAVALVGAAKGIGSVETFVGEHTALWALAAGTVSSLAGNYWRGGALFQATEY